MRAGSAAVRRLKNDEQEAISWSETTSCEPKRLSHILELLTYRQNLRITVEHRLKLVQTVKEVASYTRASAGTVVGVV